jgi:hypothetical protein
MGKSSTSFFHSLDLAELLSFENVPEYQVCQDCALEGNVIPHKITEFSENFRLLLNVDPVGTLVFVDGQADERFPVLQACMQLGAPVIVEHDAETFTKTELSDRRKLVGALGYTAFQYIAQQPETALYVKEIPEFITDDDGKRFVCL